MAINSFHQQCINDGNALHMCQLLLYNNLLIMIDAGSPALQNRLFFNIVERGRVGGIEFMLKNLCCIFNVKPGVIYALVWFCKKFD